MVRPASTITRTQTTSSLNACARLTQNATKHSFSCCPLVNDWFIGRIFPLSPTPLAFDALNEGDLLELLGSYLVWEN